MKGIQSQKCSMILSIVILGKQAFLLGLSTALKSVNKGKRSIVLHTEMETDLYLTNLLLSESKQSCNNIHTEMNRDVFKNWFKNSDTVTKKCYSTPIVIIIDSAPYCKVNPEFIKNISQ